MQVSRMPQYGISGLKLPEHLLQEKLSNIVNPYVPILYQQVWLLFVHWCMWDKPKHKPNELEEFSTKSKLNYTLDCAIWVLPFCIPTGMRNTYFLDFTARRFFFLFLRSSSESSPPAWLSAKATILVSPAAASEPYSSVSVSETWSSITGSWKSILINLQVYIN